MAEKEVEKIQSIEKIKGAYMAERVTRVNRPFGSGNTLIAHFVPRLQFAHIQAARKLFERRKKP